MKITTLLENTTDSPDLITRHGLSVLIETKTRTVLFDTGPDSSFISNAEKLKVDLSSVDFLIVSHGHKDHGGGMADFLRLNHRARIYMARSALDDHVARKGEAVIDLSVQPVASASDRFHLIDNNTEIVPGLSLFVSFERKGFIPSQNINLYEKTPDGDLILDNFEHETCLLIESEGKAAIITGCSHSGAGNMIQTVVNQSEINTPDAVIGGFHLTNPDTGAVETEEKMDQLLEELNRYPQTRYFTGHCTGESAYRYLKASLGVRLEKIMTGLTITV